MPDERFGQRVVAVTSCDEGEGCEESELIDFTRDHLSGFKLPKQVVFVAQVQRAPNGKADYKWAKKTALAAQALLESGRRDDPRLIRAILMR